MIIYIYSQNIRLYSTVQTHCRGHLTC